MCIRDSNVGVEAAGINVLGADTPIGTGATVYNSGLIVSKKGAEFQGVVTASNFSGNITLPSNDITTRNLKVTGIGTFDGNLNVLGTLTYEDVKNVDAIGISTARQGLRITGGGLNVVGVSTFGGVVDIPTVAGTNTNADLSVLFQTATGVIDGGSGLAFNPGENALKVNGTGSSGLNLTGSAVRGDGGALTLTTQNNNGQCDIHLTDILVFDTGGSERLRITSGGQVNIGGNYTQTFNALDVTGNIKASGRFNANDAVFIWQQNRMSLGNSFIIESQQNTPFACLLYTSPSPRDRG